MKDEKPFSERDVDLLVAVLSVNESMLDAAYAARVVESVVDYPIRAVDDLRVVEQRLADDEGRVRVGTRTVTLEQATQYLGPMTFPIEDREQLVSRLVCAFEAERLEVLGALAEDQARRALGRSDTGAGDVVDA